MWRRGQGLEPRGVGREGRGAAGCGWREAKLPQRPWPGPLSHPLPSPEPTDPQRRLKPGLSPSHPFLLRKQELAERVGFLLVLAASSIAAAAAACVYCCG